MNRIQDVLNEQGRTQIFLAKKLGKSYNMVNQYARNVRQPSLELLFEIARLLDVKVRDLINE